MDYTINILKFRYELYTEIYSNLINSYMAKKQIVRVIQTFRSWLFINVDIQSSIKSHSRSGMVLRKDLRFFKIVEETGELACFIGKAKKMEIDHTAK